MFSCFCRARIFPSKTLKLIEFTFALKPFITFSSGSYQLPTQSPPKQIRTHVARSSAPVPHLFPLRCNKCARAKISQLTHFAPLPINNNPICLNLFIFSIFMRINSAATLNWTIVANSLLIWPFWLPHSRRRNRSGERKRSVRIPQQFLPNLPAHFMIFAPNAAVAIGFICGWQANWQSGKVS